MGKFVKWLKKNDESKSWWQPLQSYGKGCIKLKIGSFILRALGKISIKFLTRCIHPHEIKIIIIVINIIIIITSIGY